MYFDQTLVMPIDVSPNFRGSSKTFCQFFGQMLVNFLRIGVVHVRSFCAPICNDNPPRVKLNLPTFVGAPGFVDLLIFFR